MLPSVSTGSAALTKYAQATAIAAPETSSGHDEATTRTEQDTARHKADNNTPAINPAQEKLARSARETVTALLDLLRSRVAAALIDLGVPETLALKAADSAAAQLAAALAGDSRNAAEIVHALLDRLQSGAPESNHALLNIVANGITVVIDHESGDLRVTPPQISVTPTAPAANTASPASHLLDVTDSSAEKAAPVLRALDAVHATANAYADDIAAGPSAKTIASTSPAAVFIAPTAFVDALVPPLTAALQENGTPPAIVGDSARKISALLSRAVATTINLTAEISSPAAAIPATEIMAAVARLKPVPLEDAANTGAGSRPILLAAGRIAVAIDTANGAVTVQVGNRITSYAVTSAASPISAIPPLPEIEAATLPVLDIPSGLHPGKVLDLPAGTPFVPPEIDDMPPVRAPHVPEPKKPLPTSASSAGAIARALEETLQHLDPRALRNATIVHGMEAPSTSDMPALTRIALDLTAEIGPGLQNAVVPPPLGKLGLPQPAPGQTAAGPVRKNGYTDAAANLVPVLPPTYRRGDLIARQKKKADKKQRLLPGQYQNVLGDDAMTRDMPPEHQGLVFSSVVFSV